MYLYFRSRVSGVTTLRRPCGIEYCGCDCVCFMLILMSCSFACKYMNMNNNQAAILQLFFCSGDKSPRHGIPIICQTNASYVTSCAGSRAISPALYAACCSPYTSYACGFAPWIFMIDRQQLTLGSSIDYGVIHINYVVTWTANQSDLVTLNLKVVSESRVMWATSVPILVFLGLSVLELCLWCTRQRQTSDRQTSDKSIG